MRQWLIMLMPYFGRWPVWINLFIESCKWNPDVRWRFYTDCGEPENTSANVEYVHISFDEYKAIVRERISLDFNPRDPYKLCDLKPCYGDIHRSEIAGYPFFGYGDIDLVYGRISSFYTEEVLSVSDVLSLRKDIFAGHFAVLRNVRWIREAYKDIPGLHEALRDPGIHKVDERGFYRVFEEGQTAARKIGPSSQVAHPRRAAFVNQYTTVLSPSGWHDGSANFPRTWYWHLGRITNEWDGAREFICLHFMRWKTDRYARNPPVAGEGAWVGRKNIVLADWRQLIADGFSISPTGFAPIDPSQPTVAVG